MLALELLALGSCYWVAYQTVLVRATPRGERVFQTALLGTLGAIVVLTVLFVISNSPS